MFWIIVIVGFAVYVTIDIRVDAQKRAREWERARNRAFRGE